MGKLYLYLYSASGDLFHHLYIRLSSLLFFWLGNALRQACQTICSAVFSRSSTLQLGRSLVFDALITSQKLWPVFTDCIEFKLAVLVYQALHSTAPHYFSEELCCVADMPARGRLRSSTSSLLDVRPSRRTTVADRSFATAACPRIWNGVPDDVTSATSLLTFRRKLKAHLFRQSYPDIIL